MDQNDKNGSMTTTVEKPRSPSLPASNQQVRILGIEEYEQAAATLADAFEIDEVARYFVDTDDMAQYDEAYKWKLHCDIIRYIVAAHCYKGIVTTVGEDHGAVALWMPPGKNMDDLWTILRSGMWRLWYKLSSEGKKRFYNEFLPLLHETKQEVLGERDGESYYLVYLGSRKSARGKGYAGLLIDHMCSKADLENRATYLESSAKSNLTYYKRFGFEHKTDIKLVRGADPILLHIMVREPQPVEKKGEGSMGVGGVGSVVCGVAARGEEL